MFSYWSVKVKHSHKQPPGHSVHIFTWISLSVHVKMCTSGQPCARHTSTPTERLDSKLCLMPKYWNTAIYSVGTHWLSPSVDSLIRKRQRGSTMWVNDFLFLLKIPLICLVSLLNNAWIWCYIRWWSSWKEWLVQSTWALAMQREYRASGHTTLLFRVTWSATF